MNSCNDNNRLKDLIPLYVKGLLGPEEKQKFESVLKEDPALKSELEQWQAIGAAYRKIEETIPRPSAHVFTKITERISPPPRAGFIERFFVVPSLSFGLAAAQFIIIIAMGAYMAHQKAEIKTLSAPITTPSGLLKINVIFNSKASINEVNSVLSRVKGSIIDGPNRAGLYIIGISSERDSEDALKVLRNSGIVVIAEMAY